jgi:bifunctional UDP-N-acetylglucosamine pyrophosphorylase/glucosamine-1-phosphate N-acetyltransferase
MEKGIILQDPETTYFSFDTKINSECLIEPNVLFGPGVQLERNVTIKANSYLEYCHIHSNVSVGPFARIRPGTEILEGVKIGNFVEIKKSKIGKGSKISHLSYIGDSKLGENVNIGAGTITCNYDGYEKHKTTIEDNVFIGSNTSLIAPLTIGENAIIGAGSSISKNIEKDEIGIARTEQKNIKDAARRFRRKKEKN